MYSSFTYSDIASYLLACWFRLTFTRVVSCEFEAWCCGNVEADMDAGMIAGLVVLEAVLAVGLREVEA